MANNRISKAEKELQEALRKANEAKRKLKELKLEEKEKKVMQLGNWLCELIGNDHIYDINSKKDLENIIDLSSFNNDENNDNVDTNVNSDASMSYE